MDEVIKRLRKRANEIEQMLEQQLVMGPSPMAITLALDVLTLREAADELEHAEQNWI